MSDPIIVQVGSIGQFALSVDEAHKLQAQLTRKLGARLAAAAQFVVEPRQVFGEHERPPVDPAMQAAIDEADRQLKLDLEPPAPAINHVDVSSEVFHD